MRILIATAGTRGDIQPYVALAQGLLAAGHEMTIATDAIYGSFIQANGIGFHPIRANPQKAMQEDVSNIGGNPVKFLSWLNRNMKPMARQIFIDLIDACAEVDAVIFSSLMFIAPHVAEAAGIPSLAAFLQPSSPTRAFSSSMVYEFPKWLPFRGRANWYSFRWTNRSLFLMVKGIINECRQDLLGLPPLPWRFYSSLDISDYPILYGYSPTVVPKPPDWGDWLHVCGYWFLEDKDKFDPPAELIDFLKAGSPPIYIGFGSMIDREPEDFLRLFIDAVERVGVRAVILGGWSKLGSARLPDHIIQVNYVPHDWLFPQMAAVVHHGGAGTVAAALRAGVPVVTIPFFADQPFWGQRIDSLGTGPPPIPRKKLTAGKLVQAIHLAMTDENMKQTAADIGRQIRAEDGIGTAVALVERYL